MQIENFATLAVMTVGYIDGRIFARPSHYTTRVVDNRIIRVICRAYKLKNSGVPTRRPQLKPIDD